MSIKIANRTLNSIFSKISSKKQKNPTADIYVFGADSKEKTKTDIAKSVLIPWQFKKWSENKSSTFVGAGEKNEVVLLRPARMPKEILDRDFGRLSPSEYSSIRDLVGAAVRKYVVGDKSSVLNIEFIDCNEDEVFGALVGMELAAYSYKHQSAKVSLYLSEGSKKQIEEAKNLAAGVNISRHFVNMPGNDLYPDSYAKAIKKLFQIQISLKSMFGVMQS